MDAKRLGFEDESFDVVISMEVIEHIAEQSVFLEEIKRVLRRNGVFILSTPERNFYDKGRFDFPKTSSHLKEFSSSEFERLLRSFFPCVRMYGQIYTFGLIILPYHLNGLFLLGKEICDKEIISMDYVKEAGFVPTDYRKEVAYLLAVCRKAPPKKIGRCQKLYL
jgi:SAM-dependent methyltransferase